MKWIVQIGMWALLIALACGTSDDDHGHDDHDDDHGHDHGHDDHGHDDHGHDDHGHDDDHDEGDDHDHEDPWHGRQPLHETHWTDEYEVFMEHSPILARRNTHLEGHITRLDTFTPLDGDATLHLEGPATLSFQADRLDAGIYAVDVEADEPGEYRASWQIGDERIEAGSLTIVRRGQPSEAHRHNEGTIEFPKTQQWRVRFATVFAVEGPVRPSVQVSGELTTPPSGTSHVHAPIAGRIQAPRGGLPSPGRRVRQGELLATLAPTPSSPEDATRAGLAVIDAQARIEAARAELERVQRLIAEQAVPQRRLAEAQRAMRVAEAGLSAARGAQALYASARSGRGGGGWRITAPIDGVLEEVRCSPGEAVDPNELVFRIVNPDTLWIRADVPETWAARLRADADASFQLLGTDEWRRLALGEGASLVTIGQSVDPTTRSVQVVYELGERDSSLRVGASVRVAVPVGAEQRLVSVPSTAILDAEGRDVVIVQLEGELFEERSVRLGPVDGDRVGLLAGVSDGERVVSVGGTFVRLSTTAGQDVGHGHVH